MMAEITEALVIRIRTPICNAHSAWNFAIQHTNDCQNEINQLTFDPENMTFNSKFRFRLPVHACFREFSVGESRVKYYIFCHCV